MAFDINDTSPRDQYTATASQTVFTISFEFLEDADIKAYLTPNGSDPDDTADILTLTTDFTLVGAGSNGTKELTLVTGATAGDVITVIRDAGVGRDTEFLSNGDLTIDSMNLELNKIITLIQQVEMNQEQRSLMFMRAAQIAGVSLALPAPVADSVVAIWNNSGTALEIGPTASAISGAEGEAVAAAASAAAAAAAYDSFDDRYLGEFSTPPTLDNDGEALLNGAMYWNNTTTPGKMWIYDTGAVAWGLITSANATSASSVSISDSGSHYTGTDVEAALQEIVEGITFIDTNGNILLEFDIVASSVNNIELSNAATSSFPEMNAKGEADIGLLFNDTNGNQLFSHRSAPSAVNFGRIINSATGDPIEIDVEGDDTDIDLIIAGKGSGVVSIDGIRTKVIDIGDWDMTGGSSKTTAHGLTLSKIRSAQVLIRDDIGALHGFPVPDQAASSEEYFTINSTNVIMQAATIGYFNHVNFDDGTSYNRGWITIQYTD